MTPEEIKKIPFSFVSHLAMEDCHATVYQAATVPELQMCSKVLCRDGVPYRKGTTHYKFKGIVYKTFEKLCAAMKDYEIIEHKEIMNREQFETEAKRLINTTATRVEGCVGNPEKMKRLRLMFKRQMSELANKYLISD